MNIGRLDRYVGVYSRSTSQDSFAGYYFQISQDSNKYWIRGVEEIGRKEGMRIFAESENSRS